MKNVTDSINQASQDLKSGNLNSPVVRKVLGFPFKVCWFLISLCLYLVIFIIVMLFLRSAGRSSQIASKLLLPRHR